MQTLFESPLRAISSKDYLCSKSDSYYKSYTLRNFKSIPQIQKLPEAQIEAIEVVGRIFPFKTNNYVVDELIDWQDDVMGSRFVFNNPNSDSTCGCGNTFSIKK